MILKHVHVKCFFKVESLAVFRTFSNFNLRKVGDKPKRIAFLAMFHEHYNRVKQDTRPDG